MIDKQMIIDGVDVSECKNFSCGKCEEENKIPRTINHFTTDCRMYPNCYYKQLKAKEQECKELKRQYKELGQCSKRLQKKRLNVLQMVKLLHAHKLNKSYKKSVNVRQKINEN